GGDNRGNDQTDQHGSEPFQCHGRFLLSSLGPMRRNATRSVITRRTATWAEEPGAKLGVGSALSVGPYSARLCGARPWQEEAGSRAPEQRLVIAFLTDATDDPLTINRVDDGVGA